jgi:peptide/nickel transport system permease protein
MTRFIFRRLAQMIPTIFGVIVITFILFNLVGGSPAEMTLGRNVSARALEEFDEVRGFNKPLLMGWWSGTRAFDATDFRASADPWRDTPGVARHEEEHPYLSFQPGTTYPLPLQFDLYPETGYRWVLRYRLPASGRAWLEWMSSPEDTGREPHELQATDQWQEVVVPFAVGTDPAARAPMLRVEGAPLELERIRLERRAAHLFDSQFVHYVAQLLRLDLGRSYQTDQPIGQMIREGIRPSLTLTVPIFVIGLIIALCLALVCAFFRNTWLDRFFVVFGVALMSVNYLVWIIVGQYLLAYRWGWFPVWGYESMAYLLLPVFIGIVSGLGTDLRFYRTIMLDEMYKEYVRTAFAKGVSRRGVLFKHVLKNAMITVVTNVVIAIPFLYTGSLLLESFFGIPGLGYLGINAINSADVDVIRAIVLIGSVLYVCANLLTDICYAWVDPRVRLS